MAQNNTAVTSQTAITPEEMERRYGKLIMQAARSKGLEDNLCLDVKQEVMVDFFCRHPERYNPERASLSTFLWMASCCKALDLKRKNHEERMATMEDRELEVVSDATHAVGASCEYTSEDAMLVLGETLRRMYRVNKNERQLQIFAMYVLKKVDRDEVAEYFGESPDYVSLVKTRLYPKFLDILADVEREDYEGHLKLSDKSLAFLNPILPLFRNAG